MQGMASSQWELIAKEMVFQVEKTVCSNPGEKVGELKVVPVVEVRIIDYEFGNC